MQTFLSSNLMRKLASHYFQFGYTTDYGVECYYWPVAPKTKKSQEANLLWLTKNHK